jgi:flagellar FliL protein
MAEEKTTEVAEETKKKPIVKIILLAVGLIVILGIAIGGTLFFTGAFSKTPVDAEEALLAEEEHEPAAAHGKPEASGGPAKADAHSGKGDAKGDAKGGAKGGAKGDAKGGPPQKKPLPADAQTRFEKSYMDLDDKKPLVANVANSRKVMQVSLSLMTQYDDRVFQSVEKHRAALRSTALNVLRLVTEADLVKPEFRTELAQRLRDRINAELERLENFGGIEEVFFTEFVYQ